MIHKDFIKTYRQGLLLWDMLRTSYNILYSLTNQLLAHHRHLRFSGRKMSSLSRSEVMVALQGDIDSVWAHQVLVAATMDHQLKCFFTDIHVLREMSKTRDVFNSLQTEGLEFRNAVIIDEGIFMITIILAAVVASLEPLCDVCLAFSQSFRGFSKAKTRKQHARAHRFIRGP